LQQFDLGFPVENGVDGSTRTVACFSRLWRLICLRRGDFFRRSNGCVYADA